MKIYENIWKMTPLKENLRIFETFLKKEIWKIWWNRGNFLTASLRNCPYCRIVGDGEQNQIFFEYLCMFEKWNFQKKIEEYLKKIWKRKFEKGNLKKGNLKKEIWKQDTWKNENW